MLYCSNPFIALKLNIAIESSHADDKTNIVETNQSFKY